MTVKLKFDDMVDCTVIGFVFQRENVRDARVILRRAIVELAQQKLGKVKVRHILNP